MPERFAQEAVQWYHQWLQKLQDKTHITQKFHQKIKEKRKRTQKIYKITLQLHIATEILIVLFIPLFHFESSEYRKCTVKKSIPRLTHGKGQQIFSMLHDILSILHAIF